MTASLLQMPDPLEQISKQIAAAYEQTQRGRNDWRQGTMALAQALAGARDKFNSNATFGNWLADNGCADISHQDRAALIKMASPDAIETTQTVLAKTERTSWRLIWEEEIAPLVTIAGNTAEAVQAPPAAPRKTKPNTRTTLKRFDATRAAAIDRLDEFSQEEISSLIEKLEADLKLLREKLES